MSSDCVGRGTETFCCGTIRLACPLCYGVCGATASAAVPHAAAGARDWAQAQALGPPATLFHGLNWAYRKNTKCGQRVVRGVSYLYQSVERVPIVVMEISEHLVRALKRALGKRHWTRERPTSYHKCSDILCKRSAYCVSRNCV